MEFYTNVFPMGNKLCIRGYDNGVAYSHKLDFKPTFYVTSRSKNSTGVFRTLDGQRSEEHTSELQSH